MNLTSIFEKDSTLRDIKGDGDSVIDFDSIENGVVEDDINLNGGMSFDFDDPVERENVVPVENPEVDVQQVVMTARDMMNRGFSGAEIVASIVSRYPVVVRNAARKELLSVLSMDGVVGKVALDATGYKDCKAAMKCIANSPYKSFIKHIIGCKCGKHEISAKEDSVFSSVSNAAGRRSAVDCFFDDSKSSSSSMICCPKTGLKVVAAIGEIDESFVDKTLIDMNNLTPLPSGITAKIRASSMSSSDKIKTAFKWIEANKVKVADKKYQDVGDASEFVMDVADNELDVDPEPLDDIDVDGTPSNTLDVFEIEDESVIPNDRISLSDELSDFDVDGKPEEQMDIEVSDGSNPGKLGLIDEIPESIDVGLSEEEIGVDLDDPRDVGMIDVDRNPGELDVQVGEVSDINIEMDTALDPEFEGVGNIDVDDEKTREDDLDIDTRQDWEL